MKCSETTPQSTLVGFQESDIVQVQPLDCACQVIGVPYAKTEERIARIERDNALNRKTGRIETAQEWLGHTSTAHKRAYIDAEDYREKANGVVAGLDI